MGSDAFASKCVRECLVSGIEITTNVFGNPTWRKNDRVCRNYAAGFLDALRPALFSEGRASTGRRATFKCTVLLDSDAIVETRYLPSQFTQPRAPCVSSCSSWPLLLIQLHAPLTARGRAATALSLVYWGQGGGRSDHSSRLPHGLSITGTSLGDGPAHGGGISSGRAPIPIFEHLDVLFDQTDGVMQFTMQGTQIPWDQGPYGRDGGSSRGSPGGFRCRM